jgi:acyl-CoA hydrolase
MFFAYSNGITATAQSVETATTEFGLAPKKGAEIAPRARRLHQLISG